MAGSDDPLGNEISVEAQLDATGFSASAKSRTLAALDRLCGSAIDIVGSIVERSSLRTRARTDAEIALIRVDADAARAKLLASGIAGDRTLAVFLGDQTRKQDNRDAVASAAMEDLLQSPQTSGEDDATPIDDDWLNVFTSYAERASSESLRVLWGKILAGEIRKAGTFSLPSLRILSEVDRQTAQLFEKYARTRSSDGMIPSPAQIEGQVLFDLAALEEAGLLQGVHSGIGRKETANDQGFIYLAERNRVVRLKLKEGREIRLEVIQISRAGKEIAKILPEESPDVSLAAFVDRLRDRMESVEIADILARVDETKVALGQFSSF